MNFKRKLLILLLTFIIFPLNTFAYSKYLIPGGENIGISISNDGVLIVGFYDTENGKNKDLQIGDTITSINNNSITSINDMLSSINISNSDTVVIKLGYKRDGKEYYTNLSLVKDKSGIYKTGLYVKDSVTGIGTLTFIDPKTGKYGALGHSITDSTTNIKFEIKDGKIFKSDITGIDKSVNGQTGEKNAKFYFDTIYGNIEKNLETGIFGTYSDDYNSNNVLEVGEISDIKLGKAIIKTTLTNNKVQEYEIEIVSIDEANATKNILFRITDQSLLNITGGIVKGMSGSPIIQDNKIIGAVTHTVISDNTKGYGISIVKMLESME